ncbi:MAG: DUF1016 family protein [Pasteurella sp.]|nr:DUF1016 family protein [Pasteurella sp.]
MKKQHLLSVADSEYKNFIVEIKDKIKHSQLKAAISVNYELLHLYWELGELIVKKQQEYKWGEAFLKELSNDLKKEFPDMKGFSEQNLRSIRYWFSFYSEYLIGLQAVSELEKVKNLVKSIPWGHNQRIMYKCQTVSEALFYVQKTIDNGWSRAVLEHQIESNLYVRNGKAITNFDNRLPEVQSDLAKQTLKDPYNFDFLTLSEHHNEKELENALTSQITEFLLELGAGFSYIGKQVHLKVGESDFYIDLLFYHVKLHCYVVVELKTEKFKPEFAGKLNFYITAVNKQLKTDYDNETIGILICKDKDNIVAEYSLNRIDQPIGVAEYEISEYLENKLKSSLPKIEDIEL